MKELKIFQYENSKIRTFEENGEVWFVAKDVCEYLGYEWKGGKRINTLIYKPTGRICP
ncbi:MAG: hypothetical protein HS129_04765 [Leptospiraceae bacterium]|nr:hypothetical protein [Leptospiraceae bacterium]NUM42601.1 hypothetical protein [Leptospiraceae bacterium]